MDQFLQLKHRTLPTMLAQERDISGSPTKWSGNILSDMLLPVAGTCDLQTKADPIATYCGEASASFLSFPAMLLRYQGIETTATTLGVLPASTSHARPTWNVHQIAVAFEQQKIMRHQHVSRARERCKSSIVTLVTSQGSLLRTTRASVARGRSFPKLSILSRCPSTG